MLENSVASTPSLTPTSEPSPKLSDAYQTCRAIARREAKNFYYAFLALPEAKHNAICAVYAFMRRADDISDDESQSRAARLQNLRTWVEAWHNAVATGSSSDPVFVALADARARFSVPLELLDELVQGTAMDLDPAPGSAAPRTYESFEDLYRYCYLVASVVGLVCIRIFEYTDARAEKFAEELGIAFQLTNILRDVREDAERGRIYLPLDDMAAHGVPQALLTDPIQAGTSPELRQLMLFEAGRAEHFYDSGKLLLPMIAPDSRPALWVLMTIYRRLLRRIEQADYDVFSARIKVPAYEKFAILARGLLGMARFRLRGR
jgi:phytoene synthase